MDDEIYIDDASLLTEFRSIVAAMESSSIVEENPRNRSSVSPVKASTFSAEKTAKILRMFARVVTLGSMDFFANHKRRILARPDGENRPHDRMDPQNDGIIRRRLHSSQGARRFGDNPERKPHIRRDLTANPKLGGRTSW